MTYKEIKALYQVKGFKFSEEKYKVNIYGRRSKDLVTVDKFNDILGIAWIDGFNQPQCLEFSGTTKPGLSWLKDKTGNKAGTGILVADQQYLNAWILGQHHYGKPEAYDAFVQAAAGVFKVYRDNNSDGKLDFAGKIYTDVNGLNGHRAGVNDTFNVGLYSAACQVWQDDKEHAICVALGKRSAELYGNKFNYTLFQDK